jgi:hypothetical protein
VQTAHPDCTFIRLHVDVTAVLACLSVMHCGMATLRVLRATRQADARTHTHTRAAEAGVGAPCSETVRATLPSQHHHRRSRGGTVCGPFEIHRLFCFFFSVLTMIPHGIQKRVEGGLVGVAGPPAASGVAIHAKTGDAAALHDSAKEASRHGNDAGAYRLLSAGLELAHETELRSEMLLARSVTCARLHRWEAALQASVHSAERASVRSKS